jgi:hypothetical protein
MHDSSHMSGTPYLSHLATDSVCRKCGKTLMGAGVRSTQALDGVGVSDVTYCKECWASLNATKSSDVPSLADLERHRSSASPPRGFSYMRFAGLAIGVLGAATGTAHAGNTRSVTWLATAVTAVSLLVIGERGVRRWKAEFAATAPPRLLLESRLLRSLNRAQLILAAFAIAAFVSVLFIPASPSDRWRIYLLLLAGIAGGAQLIGRLRR